jgi:16S rRNA (cytosine967-C5)-methyltransferase
MSPREAAYVALLASLRHTDYIVHSLNQWIKKQNPNKLDFAFAYEIASGSARMALALDYIGTQLSSRKKLNIKLKERALLRTAIYQHCFMDKVPLYAIVNETLEIAKKYCHKTFVSYLNALLRRFEENAFSLPQGNHPEDLSIRYSYPLYFVKSLVHNFGQDVAENILKEGNVPPKTMVRIRPGANLSTEILKHLKIQDETELPIAFIENNSISSLTSLKDIYIQNATPVALVNSLAKLTSTPSNILDLCASPGGKLLAAHDFYPNAKLFANDVSTEKIARLSQNFAKYGVEVKLTCGLGEEYNLQERFDLIILDVPCSNSGVLNKRPEARWRLNLETVEELKKMQLQLIKHSVELLSEKGVIWFLTCSILKEENEGILEYAKKHYGLTAEYERLILPNKGWDGGYGALLKKCP